GATLETAQRDKLELVCRKLDLKPGMRLLDVGCGWGSMAIHAAREHGVTVVGVTLSGEQAAYARKRIAEEGLTDRIEIRVQDYRDVTDGPYDAI
ncbi:class I SAM-dependent methyltransferase, partial [Streptomyces sp. TRM76130]|nr:class I SAM-dependent methyltransferase [Streptomyces sp. TRM76130]